MQKKIGQATNEQIESWKKQYGKIFTYEVDGKICYLRTVDRDTYALAAAKVTVSPAKFNDEIIAKVWLGGDDEIKTNDSYYFGLVEVIEELMNKKKGKLGEC